jgi:hypothetical protein
LASLVVATSDLQLVQDVIGAIRAADANEQAANAGRIPPIPPTPAPAQPAPSNSRSCDSVCCGVGNENRRAVDLSPCYKPDRVSRWTLPHAKPRLALEVCAQRAAVAPVADHPTKSPIQPPWAVLPWQQPPKQIVQVKVIHRHTDIVTKGSLIDVFI